MPKRTGMHLLKAVALRSLPPGRHADGGGLYFAVSKNGAGRSWMFRTRRDGKLREMGLGGWHSVTLEKARRKAAELRDAFLDGRDPVAEKKQAQQAKRVAEAKATTFEEAAKAYIRAHRAGWKSPKSQVSWEHTLSAFAYPVIGNLPVDAIDTDLVMKVLGQCDIRQRDRPADRPGAAHQSVPQRASASRTAAF
jgi:hypothetical protein